MNVNSNKSTFINYSRVGLYKYNTVKNDYNLIVIQNLINEVENHSRSVFKDNLMLSERFDFLGRLHRKVESVSLIRKIVHYYIRYTFISPNFSPLINLNTIIKRFLRKKRRIFENLQAKHDLTTYVDANKEEFSTVIKKEDIDSMENKEKQFKVISEDLFKIRLNISNIDINRSLNSSISLLSCSFPAIFLNQNSKSFTGITPNQPGKKKTNRKIKNNMNNVYKSNEKLRLNNDSIKKQNDIIVEKKHNLTNLKPQNITNNIHSAKQPKVPSQNIIINKFQNNLNNNNQVSTNLNKLPSKALITSRNNIVSSNQIKANLTKESDQKLFLKNKKNSSEKDKKTKIGSLKKPVIIDLSKEKKPNSATKDNSDSNSQKKKSPVLKLNVSSKLKTQKSKISIKNNLIEFKQNKVCSPILTNSNQGINTNSNSNINKVSSSIYNVNSHENLNSTLQNQSAGLNSTSKGKVSGSTISLNLNTLTSLNGIVPNSNNNNCKVSSILINSNNIQKSKQNIEININNQRAKSTSINKMKKGNKIVTYQQTPTVSKEKVKENIVFKESNHPLTDRISNKKIEISKNNQNSKTIDLKKGKKKVDNESVGKIASKEKNIEKETSKLGKHKESLKDEKIQNSKNLTIQKSNIIVKNENKAKTPENLSNLLKFSLNLKILNENSVNNKIDRRAKIQSNDFSMKKNGTHQSNLQSNTSASLTNFINKPVNKETSLIVNQDNQIFKNNQKKIEPIKNQILLKDFNQLIKKKNNQIQTSDRKDNLKADHKNKHN